MKKIKKMKILFPILAVILAFHCSSQNEVNTIQPSIIIVPFVKQGQDLRQTIENDFNKRKAISLIKEEFLNRGFQTIDFIQKFKAQQTTNQMSRDAQESLKNQIISNSGADILVTVEFNVTRGSRGNSVGLILSANDVYSGSNMGEKSPSSPQFNTDDYSKLIQKAMEDPEDGVEAFLVSINEAFGRIVENGRDLNLVIRLDKDCPFKFNEDIDDDFNTLSSVINAWGKKAAYKGVAKKGPGSPTSFSFEPIKVPLRDEDGNNYNTDNLIKSLRRELKKNYNIKTQPDSGASGVSYLRILGYYE